MSKIVWLKDGRKCKLISKTDDGKYIVDPFRVVLKYSAETDDGIDEFEELSNKLVQVDQVYNKPPIDVIDAEYKELEKRYAEKDAELDILNKEFNRAKFELQQITKQKTDLLKTIINLNELKAAKRIIVWPKDKIAPRIMDGLKGQKIVISYTIEHGYMEKERVWMYEGYTDQKEANSYSYWSEHFDPEFGIKVDLTDDEITAITHERQNKTGKFGASDIVRTPDKWLTPENVERKKEFIKADSVLAIQKAKQDVKDAQERLNNLISPPSKPASW